MRNILLGASLVLAVLVVGSVAAAKAPTASRPREQDEKAIRQVVDAVAKAFDAKDAKAMAALFTQDAEIVNEDGEVSQGREAIEQAFQNIFDDDPKAHIDIHVESIRFVG